MTTTQRHPDSSFPLPGEAPARWQSHVRASEIHSMDGTRIYYEAVGDGPKTLLLANGLGGRLHAWAPLLEALHGRYRLLTWDYRGLFESDSPPSRRSLAINRHVEDAVAILDAENVHSAVLCGWSMGVQVSLDVAAMHPSRVDGLVLLNGTYGHVFSTALQPLFTVPGIPKLLHFAVRQLRDEPRTPAVLRTLARWSEAMTLLAFTLTAGRRAFSLGPTLRQYKEDVLGESFDHFMHLFQELDAHSVYHVLGEITAPALVISGALDPLTPARQSREMAKHLPRAERLALLRASHFALLERPEVVVPAIERFLAALG